MPYQKENIDKNPTSFSEKDFHHLAGFHYLNNRSELRSDRTKIFDKILNDETFAERIQKSDNYPKIKDRVFYLAKLEDYEKYICNSFFPESDYDYSQNQIL